MRIRVAFVILLLALALALAVAGCSSGSAATPSSTQGPGGASVSKGSGSGSDVAALITATCSRCHPLARVKAASHDAAGWTVTITRMRQQHGARIDDTQAKQIVDFLAGGGGSQL